MVKSHGSETVAPKKQNDRIKITNTLHFARAVLFLQCGGEMPPNLITGIVEIRARNI
jgi:hypothetical protein